MESTTHEGGNGLQIRPLLFLLLLLPAVAAAQGTEAAIAAKTETLSGTVPWTFSLTADGYIVPSGQSYVSPIFTADHNWLHLEGRYNDENLRTGSIWVGYNLSWGEKVVFEFTPMLGGVFGRTTGIAPGIEAALTYKKLQLSLSNEYVFDTGSKAGNFYYSWPQLTYSWLEWLKFGLVAQHTKAFETTFKLQPGFFVGVSHKNLEFTTYIFDVGRTDTSAVLEVGYIF